MFRTVEQCYQLIKQSDPASCITKYRIREWCKLGKVSVLDADSKILIDYRTVEELLNIKN